MHAVSIDENLWSAGAGDQSLGGADAGAAPLDAPQTLALLRRWSMAGGLRHLDSALPAWVLAHDPQVAACVLGAVALLVHLEGRGHSGLPLSDLLRAPAVLRGKTEAQAAELQALWAPWPPTVALWAQALAACPLVRVVGPGDRDDNIDKGQPLVLWTGDATAGRPAMLYLRRYWYYEQSVARHMRERSALTQGGDAPLVRDWLGRLFVPDPAHTAHTTDAAPPDCQWQKVACALAMRGRITVITGGPGTGKTYTAARLLALLFASAENPTALRVALAAPTGKAAARLKQSIDDALGDLQAQVGNALDMAALVQQVGPARTLHALLGARPGTRHMGRQAGRTIEVDVLIVDEASMVHLEMMATLLDALAPSARLVLLGDKDQLASVEAGAVLADFCAQAQQGGYDAQTLDWIARASGEIIPAAYHAKPRAQADPQANGQAQPKAAALAQQTVMLRQSRRFGGPIGQLAEAVNAGDVARARAVLAAAAPHAHRPTHAPLAQQQGGAASEIVTLALQGRAGAPGYGAFIAALGQRPRSAASKTALGTASKAALETASEGASGRGSESTSDRPTDSAHAAHTAWVMAVLQAFDTFRLLCAVREGQWGVAGINRAIEQALEHEKIIRRSAVWYAGRPVMVTHNDAALGVFNGDIGVALPDAGTEGRLRVYFLQGQALRSVPVARLSAVETAFAMTVHKSQGSEFRHTALVLSASAPTALGRELVYTGITRAREAFTLLCERPGLLEQAIAQPTLRYSGLAQWLGG